MLILLSSPLSSLLLLLKGSHLQVFGAMAKGTAKGLVCAARSGLLVGLDAKRSFSECTGQ